jgi:tocopherol O-methyltransferase
MIVPAAPVPALSHAAGVAHHYDEPDPFYRNLWGEHLHHGLWRSGSEPPAVAVLQLLELVASRAGLEPGARVCDVGAGYGASARWLASRYGAQVTALTLSPAQYAYACAQPTVPGAPTPRYLLQDWLSNTLPGGSADVVIALESTEHMADLKRCFAQLRRVLRPGGRFVICAWLACETPEPWEIRLLLEPICREGRLAGLGSMSEYRSALEGAGLVVDTEEDLSREVRRTWGVVLRRLFTGLLSERAYRRYLLDARQYERLFVWTVARMALAYRTGSLRYGLLSGYREP